MRFLPDPKELPPGSLVIVPNEVTPRGRSRSALGRRILGVFGRTKTVSRALRCSALVARGYVRVGAVDASDPHGTDLTWGYTSIEPTEENRERGAGNRE
jgi:hypothetical protein